jgi:hypothetical protein
MSQTIQAESKTKKVQTTLTYKQTNETNQTKGDMTKPSQAGKLKQNADKDYMQTQCVGSKKEFVSEIPAIVTLPEIRRVLDTEGVTKIVMDLETSSRGR